MYEEITKKIKITVNPEFLEEHSDPDEKRFIWAYHIKIENQGIDTVQLLSRSWKITDALGRVQEVNGSGVVGEQPVLKPGTSFEYTSGTPLKTPSGFMMGFYKMEKENGDSFNASIPAFSLDSPHESGLSN
jgi:ApaG protein